MAKVELRDRHKGVQSHTLDSLIEQLTEIRDQHQCGGAGVTMLMEPLIDGEEHQIEESICEVGPVTAYVKGGTGRSVTWIYLAGRSFD